MKNQEIKQLLCGILAQYIKTEGQEKIPCDYNLAIDDAIEAIIFNFPKDEPHIICLASAKHYRLRPAMTAKSWVISLVKIGNRSDKFVAKGETFWEAEKIARKWLEDK